MGEVKKMETSAVEDYKAPEKMSYEQLENVAHQLSEQAKQMYSKLQEANMTNMFKRLDYLFKVIENKSVFPESFVDKSINEIVDIMTVPEVADIQGPDSEQ